MRKTLGFLLVVIMMLVCCVFALSEENRIVKITTEDLAVAVSGKLTLKAEVENLSETAPKKTAFVWSSTDEGIAKVTPNGVVSGVSVGETAIICKAKDDESISCSVTVSVYQPIKTMKADNTNISLVLGAGEDAATGKIIISIEPDNASDKTCTFVSSNEDIVSVDENGTLRAKAAGKAKVTVIPNEKGSKQKVVCNVTVGQAVTQIKLNTETATVDKGRTLNLKATVLPDNAYNKKVEYTSSNPSVVSVNKAGVVKGVECGTGIITCTALDGSNTSASVTVKVIQPVTSVTSNEKKIELFEGESKRMIASVKPADATTKKLTYSSSDNWVASVDSDGTIKAKWSGKATITAKTTDGSNRSASMTVIVEPSVPISLDSIGFGIFNYNLLGITVTNKCSAKTIVDFGFNLDFYDYGGRSINGGSYSLGSPERIGPGRQKTIKRTVYGTGQAYKTVITITSVEFADGSIRFIPKAEQETWSFTR